MGKYSIAHGYIVLDENSDAVDWFDTEEEAQNYIDSLDA
jgi:hypothetical protein